MKSILTKSALGLILLLAGYFIAQVNSIKTSLALKSDKCEISTADATSIYTVTPSVDESHLRKDSDVNDADASNFDIKKQLSDTNVEIRLNALYIVWRNNIGNQFNEEIGRLAREDPNHQVQSFARWIQEMQINSENAETAQINVQLNDYQSPDVQLRASLIENPSQYQQANEQLNEERDLLESMTQLPEDEQLAYIDELIELQDDESVNALNKLILSSNPALQNAAIDGLITLMEMRTGHFDMIVQSMKQNYVYMSDVQLEKFSKLTEDEKNFKHTAQ